MRISAWIAIVCIGLCLGFAQAQQINAGLICHLCEYNEIIPPSLFPSSKTCEKSPLSTEIGNFEYPDEIGPGGQKVKVYPYCFTTMGHIAGKAVVIRGGAPLLVNPGSVCEDSLPGFADPIPGLKGIKTCYCNKEKCNTHVDDGSPSPTNAPESTKATEIPEATTEGASSIGLNAALLLFLLGWSSIAVRYLN